MKTTMQNTPSLRSAASFLKRALLCAVCAALFFSACSSEDGGAVALFGDSGQVVFSLSSSVAKDVQAAAPGQDMTLLVTLSGPYSQSKSATVTDGATIVFEGVPTGFFYTLKGEAYVQDESPDGNSAQSKKVYYDGPESSVYVQKGTNYASLSLTRIYYLYFNANGGEWTNGYPANDHYKKGKAIDLPTSSDIQRAGQIFAGWWTSSDGGTTLDQKFKFTEETKGDYALYAKWVENGIGGITVTIYSETNDLELAVEPFTESGGGYKFTATPPEAGEYTYAWYVDGVSESDAGSTENEFTFRKVNGDGSLVVKGVYDIKVEVKKSGSTKWSAFAQAKVE